MAKRRRIHVRGENRLLADLPRDDYDRLLPHLEKVSLPLRDILYEANGPIPHVFFPLNGVVSLVISWTATSPSKWAPSATKAWSAPRSSWGPTAARRGRFRRFPARPCGWRPRSFRRR